MSVNRGSLLIKRSQNICESDESDSDVEPSPTKRMRRYVHEGNFQESVSRNLYSALRWAGTLPLKYYLQLVSHKGSFSNMDTPEVIDLEDNPAGIDDISILHHSKDSSERVSTRSGRNKGTFSKSRMSGASNKQPISSTPLHLNLKSNFIDLSNCISAESLPMKPIRVSHYESIGVRRSKKAFAPITDPEVEFDIPIPVECGDDDDDGLELSAEFKKAKSILLDETRSSRKAPHGIEKSKTNGDQLWSKSSLNSGSRLRRSKSYTAHEVMRLGEKEQYGRLLKSMSKISNNSPNGSFSKMSKRSDVTIDLTVDYDEPLLIAVKDDKKREDYVEKFKRLSAKQNSEIDDFDEDIHFLKEVKKPMQRPHFKHRPDFFSPNWIENLKSTVDAETGRRKALITLREQTTEYYRDRRQAKLDEEKKKLDRFRESGINVDKAPDLPVLTPEMERIIDFEFSCRSGQNEVAVTINCSNEKFSLTHADLQTLSGPCWLNDSVIACYLKMIQNRSEEQINLPSVFTFNTFFYVNLSTKGYRSVARWTRKVNIFEKDLVFIPLHVHNLHWTLGVIDNKKKEIRYYDSMSNGDRYDSEAMGCLNYLHEYLIRENEDKKRTKESVDYSTRHMNNIPQQMNGSDCGVFVLQFAEYLSRGAPITFSQANMPYFRRRIVYECMNARLM